MTPHTKEKVKTEWGSLYWKACGCEASEEETECRYCSQEFKCHQCGWTGNYPPQWDGGPFGGLHVCPKCNWTQIGMLHVGAGWIVINEIECTDEE